MKHPAFPVFFFPMFQHIFSCCFQVPCCGRSPPSGGKSRRVTALTAATTTSSGSSRRSLDRWWARWSPNPWPHQAGWRRTWFYDILCPVLFGTLLFKIWKKWRFPEKNRGNPQSSSILEFSTINHPVWIPPWLWKLPNGGEIWEIFVGVWARKKTWKIWEKWPTLPASHKVCQMSVVDRQLIKRLNSVEMEDSPLCFGGWSNCRVLSKFHSRFPSLWNMDLERGPSAGKTRREMEAMMIGEIVKFNRWLIEARLGSEHVSITQQENGDLTIINAGINSARGQRKNTSSIGGFVMAGSETSMTSFNPTFNPQCQHVKSRKIMMNPDVCCWNLRGSLREFWHSVASIPVLRVQFLLLKSQR